MQVNYQELSHILAALRHWQDTFEDGETGGYDHFLDVAPLTRQEVNDLCERLCTSEVMLKGAP